MFIFNQPNTRMTFTLHYPGWLRHLTTGMMVLVMHCAISSQDASWKIKYISTESGLSNRFVNSVIQDKRGYIWISTKFGLNRYDGHQFDILTRESHHLQDNNLNELYLDHNDNIWVAERNAPGQNILWIDILDPISLTVQPLEQYIGTPLPFKINEIQRIVNDSTQNIFILTKQNEVYRFDQNKLIHLFTGPPSQRELYLGVSSAFITIIARDLDSIDLWDKNGKWLSRHPVPHNDAIMVDTMSWQPVGYIGNKLVLLGTETVENFQYFVLVDMNGFSAPKPFLSNTRKNTFCTFDMYQKILWLHDGKQYFTLNPISGQITYKDTGLKIANFQGPVYCDPLHLVWATFGNGVSMLSQQPQYFKAYLTDQEKAISCRGFAEDKDGNVYSFSNNGSFIFHRQSGTIEQKGIKEYVLGAITDTDGNIWLSSEGSALIKYIPGENRQVSYTIDHRNIYFAAWAIHQVRSGQILIGTTEGLWVKNPLDDADPIPFTKLNGYTLLDTSCIYHILETEEGIWLSTDNGLFLVDMDKGVLEHIDEESDHLPNNNILFLHKDADNIYWIASRGGGLIRWDREKKIFRRYTVNEGLSHNIIYAIYEDDYGFFWMPSDFGLMRFEKATGICRTFLQPEGIPHEEFNRASYFKDSKGYLYFGGLNGFITFHPKDMLQVHSIKLPVRLTRFEAINEKTGEVQDLTYEASISKGLRLSPQISSFIIHYSILDFDDPQLKRYAYRIDGLNTNWTYLKENFIRINGLKGGEYTIRIKGQSSTGQWSENELIIPVEIQKTFFARWYTQAAMLLLLLLIFYTILRKRSELHQAKLKRDQEVIHQLRQVDKLKDQFLANTSHELRTPLNGIVGLSESLLEKIDSEAEVEDLELIIASGRRLSNLVNDILDFSRLKEHDLQLKKGPVDIRTIAELCLRMNRQLLSGKNIVLQNNIPENLPYCLADENRLQQILQNLVANAIKFTKEGKVSIDAMVVEDMLVTSITDTGIGIDKEKQDVIFREFEQGDGSIAREYGGTGLGLSITKYLVELHGGSIGVVSEPEKGSVFSFTIPLAPDSSVPLDTSSNEKDFVSTLKMQSGEEILTQHDTQPRAILRLPITQPGPPAQQPSPTTHVSPITNGNEKRHILVVDDEPVNLKVLKNHLEREGYLVTLAHDGQEALQLLENGTHFHLVLLDVMMPRTPGYEVCQKIRERYLLTELPVIMVTAKNQINDLVEGLGIGANDYIVKPFSKDELLARVKTQLDNYDIHVATNRFVPHEFIHSLGRKSIMDLHRGDMVEQHTHVMFSDIRDYTTLAEDMTPRENFQFVNALAGKIGPIVKSNHGIINQYLGDTIMMLFMQKADHGMQAGIDILKLIRLYNQEREMKSRKPIRVGIGLHSGPLMMGIIGDSLRTDAAVISDTVNTASRMEGLTKHFNVNFILSGDTLMKLDDRERFNLRYLGKVQAKGKNQPIEVYECFDGDSPEQIALKKASLHLFHAGMEAYFNKDMILARNNFDKVYLANPADSTTFGFLHKLHGYIHAGVPEGWTGVEVMTSK